MIDSFTEILNDYKKHLDTLVILQQKLLCKHLNQ